MLFIENMKLAFSAIRINKMRSFLTMLGMIIGISSVIAIVSIGDTMRSLIADEYANIGMGKAIVYVMSSDGYYSNSDLFTFDDVETIKQAFGDKLSYIDSQAGLNGDIVKGRRTTKIAFTGVSNNYTDVQPVKILYGRMINDKDIEGEKPNVVIEEKTAISLFGKADIVGKVLKISISEGRSTRIEEVNVVGVYQNTTSALMKMMQGNSTDMGYIPESFIMAKDSSFWNLNIYMADGVDFNVFKNQFTGLVSRMKNRTPQEIRFYSAVEEMSSMDGMMQNLSLAVGAIAAISLVVGGIGIMNIMLVSVTERTREIGIRKALGARTRDVLMQFLIESAIISAVGGIIGTTLGAGMVIIGGTALGVGVVVRTQVVVIAVAFSAVVGIFFGLYPASKAAKADPITALRYE